MGSFTGVWRNVTAGASYFALAFGAGFVLGAVRVLWVVPRVGERTAELLEAPIMLVVIFVAARWVTRRLAVPRAWRSRIAVGGVGLALLLAAELATIAGLRGLTLGQYVASRDPVSGSVYLALLGLFAVMPALVTRSG